MIQKETAQRRSLQCRWQFPQGRKMQSALRIKQLGGLQKFVFQIFTFGAVFRATNQRRHRIPAGNFRQQRKRLIAQPVADGHRLTVACVLTPTVAAAFKPPDEFGTPHA